MTTTDGKMMCSGQERSLDFLAPGWAERLGSEFSKPYMENLRELLRSEYRDNHAVYPPKNCIFRALKMVDYDDVKVVIIGQDPYHGPHQANGLAFAVQHDIPAPPSLVNIFKEVAADLRAPQPTDTTLEGWAAQGVLLLNAVLTVRANTPLSHRNKGWEIFTGRAIEELNKHERPLVFLLWGASAQEKAKYITDPRHLILKAPHPSPLSAHRGFLGCRHFSKANDFLEKYTEPINWLQTGLPGAAT